MQIKKITAFALAGMLTAALAVGVLAQDITVDPAIASMTPEQVVDKRQELMKANGGVLKGAGALTGAEAVAAADTLITNFSNLTALFPEGSIVGDSRALPVIWTDHATFVGYFAKNVERATAMRAAAEAGDADAYGAAIKEIGGSCDACHQVNRGS